MKYKDYIAQIEYDEAHGLFRGRVVGMQDRIEFAGKNMPALKAAFQQKVEDYIETCAKFGRKRQTSYSDGGKAED